MKKLVRHARVLVTDGAKALVYRNEGDALTPDLRLMRSYAQDNPPTRDQGSDKPGRTNASTGVNRSSMEAPDWHQVAEDQFVAGIAEDMNKDLRAGEFESLVVVAPPAALGVYRKAVPAAVAKVTLAEIDKDLVKHPAKDVTAIVVKVLEGA
jgi:protein required for attachment to host cells